MTGRTDTAQIREVFQNLHEAKSLPDVKILERILDTALGALVNENPLIRPRDESGRPGGLVLLNPHITTVLVPDLHARTGYLNDLIEMNLEGRRLLECLDEGILQILCVGDGFHSEGRGADRWRRAWREYRDGFREHRAMDEEMRESLSLMAMVMILKASYPDRFHFLKGNHENVANSDIGGNRPFGKYAWEGQMVKDWFLEFLGTAMLDKWAEFESNLPILALGDRFLVSHAEPRRAYGRERIIGYRGDDELIFDFTWTGNGEAEEESVRMMLDEFLGETSRGALYFGGHRPVQGLYGLRSQGLYVQIHNPDRYVVAVLESGRDPSPVRDIRTIDGESA